ncbi:MAG: thioredoxin [Bacteroidaceae bacterium]|nr:thioredoxin [Bacteroidaceae bacterium]
MALHITSENFKELTQSGKPLVLDFWATWCGPCKRLAPIIEELATEYEGRVNIGKCDVEEDDELAMQFQVSSIPTVVFFNKQGEMFKRLVGLQSKATLVENIEQLL